MISPNEIDHLSATIKSLNEQIMKEEGELSKVRSNLKYKSLPMVEKMICRLQQALQTRNFPLSEESKIVVEINDLNRSKKHIQLFEEKRSVLQQRRHQIKELRSLLDSWHQKKRDLKRIERKLSQSNLSQEQLSSLLKHKETVKRDIHLIMIESEDTAREIVRNKSGVASESFDGMHLSSKDLVKHCKKLKENLNGYLSNNTQKGSCEVSTQFKEEDEWCEVKEEKKNRRRKLKMSVSCDNRQSCSNNLPFDISNALISAGLDSTLPAQSLLPILKQKIETLAMEDDDGCMDDQSESFVNDCSFDPSPETTQYDSSTDQLINKPYYNSTYNPSPMYPYKASNSLWGVNTTTSPPSSLCNTSVLEDRLMMSEDSGTFELDTEVVFHRPFQATTSTTPSTTAPLNYKGALIRNMCKD